MPLGGAFCFFHSAFSRNSRLLLSPFLRYRCSVSRSPAFLRSRIPRRTVEGEYLRSAAMVGMAGQPALHLDIKKEVSDDILILLSLLFCVIFIQKYFVSLQNIVSKRYKIFSKNCYISGRNNTSTIYSNFEFGGGGAPPYNYAFFQVFKMR